MRPEVLVLYGPAAGLDPRGRKEILGGLSRYVKEYGATVILVSHSMEDMAYYCDNVVVMYKGKIYKEGAVDEVFSDSASMSSIGLDVPVVAKIAASLKKSGIDLDGKLYTVEGVKNAILKYIGGDNK
jgi:energy-coupling factor transport system ATP-binding protein